MVKESFVLTGPESPLSRQTRGLHSCSSFRSSDKIFSTHNPEAFVVETTGHFFLSEETLLLIAQLRLWSVALY